MMLTEIKTGLALFLIILALVAINAYADERVEKNTQQHFTGSVNG